MVTRVLLLEDNREVAESMLRAFGLLGIEVVHAASVEEAKNVYSIDEFDVMVIDYELPDGNGLEFLATIRGADKAITVLHSGLDRSREITASGLHVDHQVGKEDPGKLLEIIKQAGS